MTNVHRIRIVNYGQYLTFYFDISDTKYLDLGIYIYKRIINLDYYVNGSKVSSWSFT